MRWTIDSTTAVSIIDAVRLTEAMHTHSRRMLGITATNQQFEETLKTLGLSRAKINSPDITPATIADTVSASLRPDPERGLPDWLKTLHDQLSFDLQALSLITHLGLAPCQLLSATAFSVHSKARGDNGWEVHLKPEFNKYFTYNPDQIRPVDIRITMPGGACWSPGRLTLGKTRMADTIIQSLPGRSLGDIINHDWPGWQDMEIKSARNIGPTTQIVYRVTA